MWNTGRLTQSSSASLEQHSKSASAEVSPILSTPSETSRSANRRENPKKATQPPSTGPTMRLERAAKSASGEVRPTSHQGSLVTSSERKRVTLLAHKGSSGGSSSSLANPPRSSRELSGGGEREREKPSPANGKKGPSNNAIPPLPLDRIKGDKAKERSSTTEDRVKQRGQVFSSLPQGSSSSASNTSETSKRPSPSITPPKHNPVEEGNTTGVIEPPLDIDSQPASLNVSDQGAQQQTALTLDAGEETKESPLLPAFRPSRDDSYTGQEVDPAVAALLQRAMMLLANTGDTARTGPSAWTVRRTSFLYGVGDSSSSSVENSSDDGNEIEEGGREGAGVQQGKAEGTGSGGAKTKTQEIVKGEGESGEASAADPPGSSGDFVDVPSSTEMPEGSSPGLTRPVRLTPREEEFMRAASKPRNWRGLFSAPGHPLAARFVVKILPYLIASVASVASAGAADTPGLTGATTEETGGLSNISRLFPASPMDSAAGNLTRKSAPAQTVHIQRLVAGARDVQSGISTAGAKTSRAGGGSSKRHSMTLSRRRVTIASLGSRAGPQTGDTRGSVGRSFFHFHDGQTAGGGGTVTAATSVAALSRAGSRLFPSMHPTDATSRPRRSSRGDSRVIVRFDGRQNDIRYIEELQEELNLYSASLLEKDHEIRRLRATALENETLISKLENTEAELVTAKREAAELRVKEREWTRQEKTAEKEVQRLQKELDKLLQGVLQEYRRLAALLVKDVEELMKVVNKKQEEKEKDFEETELEAETVTKTQRAVMGAESVRENAATGGVGVAGEAKQSLLTRRRSCLAFPPVHTQRTLLDELDEINLHGSDVSGADTEEDRKTEGSRPSSSRRDREPRSLEQSGALVESDIAPSGPADPDDDNEEEDEGVESSSQKEASSGRRLVETRLEESSLPSGGGWRHTGMESSAAVSLGKSVRSAMKSALSPSGKSSKTPRGVSLQEALKSPPESAEFPPAPPSRPAKASRFVKTPKGLLDDPKRLDLKTVGRRGSIQFDGDEKRRDVPTAPTRAVSLLDASTMAKSNKSTGGRRGWVVGSVIGSDAGVAVSCFSASPERLAVLAAERERDLEFLEFLQAKLETVNKRLASMNNDGGESPWELPPMGGEDNELSSLRSLLSPSARSPGVALLRRATACPDFPLDGGGVRRRSTTLNVVDDKEVQTEKMSNEVEIEQLHVEAEGLRSDLKTLKEKNTILENSLGDAQEIVTRYEAECVRREKAEKKLAEAEKAFLELQESLNTVQNLLELERGELEQERLRRSYQSRKSSHSMQRRRSSIESSGSKNHSRPAPLTNQGGSRQQSISQRKRSLGLSSQSARSGRGSLSCPATPKEKGSSQLISISSTPPEILDLPDPDTRTIRKTNDKVTTPTLSPKNLSPRQSPLLKATASSSGAGQSVIIHTHTHTVQQSQTTVHVFHAPLAVSPPAELLRPQSPPRAPLPPPFPGLGKLLPGGGNGNPPPGHAHATTASTTALEGLSPSGPFRTPTFSLNSNSPPSLLVHLPLVSLPSSSFSKSNSVQGEKPSGAGWVGPTASPRGYTVQCSQQPTPSQSGGPFVVPLVPVHHVGGVAPSLPSAFPGVQCPPQQQFAFRPPQLRSAGSEGESKNWGEEGKMGYVAAGRHFAVPQR
uniref:Uncharacterized protein n=1 Tax=Chromera velia CCMP2878 TaxID=1169474 RepID=A0A0G4HI40_9ALVE|eukprot:Cvel_1050.t1-p1 / transcript=Cvel_1050.t1 / gene=Cvel_1050 / organism=Chromera_velia_CCMP2878 / gene_product=hypothetical protein / transcript_product=hypothetical protein / location=Cvel_scaffold34:53830-65103(+) / protein_length=1640 / sequence_SO=supercontig / SO=protein_coding / is_pseudo=false